MKLRIRGNNLRLRLLKSEVAELAESSRIAKSITLGPTPSETLTYAIQISENATEVNAGYCENEICVILPRPVAEEWTVSDLVGITAKLDVGDGKLEILVEKDFVCSTRTDDPDNADAYPNPEDSC